MSRKKRTYAFMATLLLAIVTHLVLNWHHLYEPEKSSFQRGRSNSEETALLKDQSERDDKPTKKVKRENKKVKREKKKGWRTNQSKPVGEKEMKTEPFAAVAQGCNNLTANKPTDMFSATMRDNSIPARGESKFVNSPTQATAVVTSITDQVKEKDLSQVGDDIKLIEEQTSELNRLVQSISQMIQSGQESYKKK